MLADHLTTDRLIALRLADGTPIVGRVVVAGDGWLHLRDPDGDHLINLAQVAAIRLQVQPHGEAAPHGGLPRPSSKDQPRKLGARAPGRPWDEVELKALSEAFLDGEGDAELAERFHRTRGQITELHRGFECARGNLVEDQISPAARLWVARWQRVLAG